MSYEAGFAVGERRSFQDRMNGTHTRQPTPVRSQWQRGFWDGYEARTVAWISTTKQRKQAEATL